MLFTQMCVVVALFLVHVKTDPCVQILPAESLHE